MFGIGMPGKGGRIRDFVWSVQSSIMSNTLHPNPDVGRVVPEFGLNSLRELIHPPFRIIYRRDSDTVRIVRVWRSERRLRPIDDGEGESS